MKNKILQILERLKAKKTNLIWAALSILCIIIIIVGIVWFVSAERKKTQAQNTFEELAEEMQVPIEETEEQSQDVQKETVETEEKTEPVDPYEKKVDFTKLQGSVESNIYSWIYIPDTMIDYPILQHPSDNYYYLNHNLNGSTGYPGCIYTENYNKKDFTDPNTVIYGHNMKNGTMFADVHKFESEEFVEEHPFVYIYLPGKMYVYEIYAAYEYGDTHLVVNKDLSVEREFEGYLTEVKNTAIGNGFYKEDVQLTTESNIITLSTCISSQKEKRFLLQAVLCEQVEMP